jgi:hypothetical protein
VIGSRLLARAVLAAALVGTGARAAYAHGLGMSQLELRVDGARLSGQWQIQLPDARRAVGLDPQVGGEAGRREVAERDPALSAYLAQRIAFVADGAPCQTTIDPAPAVWQPDAAQATFRLSVACPAAVRHLHITCDLLFDADPKHRAYFSIEDARVTSVGLFRADQRSADLDVRQLHAGADFLEFVLDGIGHIWTGVDHLLFLIALLLPAPLARSAQGAWSPRAGLTPTAREVLKVVTAFTAAHSLTLALAFFGVVSFAARWVEVAIALSVFAAAWNNLRPFLPERGWAMAFVFGLVHGLGFAGALRNLALPIRARGLALVAFNVGVECGQLAIVAPLLPLLYAASRRRWYPRLVMGVGSLAIAWVAMLWILERGLGMRIFNRS